MASACFSWSFSDWARFSNKLGSSGDRSIARRNAPSAWAERPAFEIARRQLFEKRRRGRIAQERDGPLIRGNRLVPAARPRSAPAKLCEGLPLIGFDFDRAFKAGGCVRRFAQIQKRRTEVHPGLHVALIQLNGLLEAGDCAAVLAAVRQRDAQIVVRDGEIGLQTEGFAELFDRLHGTAERAIDVAQAVVVLGPAAVGVDGLPDIVDGRNLLVALEGDDPQEMQGVAMPRIDAEQVAANRLGPAPVAGPVKLKRRLKRL